jgi:hypothetical protein
MSLRSCFVGAAVVAAFSAGFFVRGAAEPVVVHAAQANRVFEMRTYIASAGKLDALNARFRDHTLGYFKKYNMTSIGYWTPAEGQPGAGNTITYLLAHESRAAADKSWAAFNADAEWLKVRTASSVNGNPVARVDRLFLTPLDYSPIK